MSRCMRLVIALLVCSGALFAAEPRSTWVKTGDGSVMAVDHDIAELLKTLVDSAPFGSSTELDPLLLEPVAKKELDIVLQQVRFHSAKKNTEAQSLLNSLSVDQLSGVIKAANFLQAPDEVLSLLCKHAALRIMAGTFGDIKTIDQQLPRELHQDIIKHFPDVFMNLETIALRRLKDGEKTIQVKSTGILTPSVQVFDLAISTDGSLLCASAHMGCVMISLADNKVVWRKEYSRYVNAVHFIDNDQKVAVGCEDKVLRIYRSADGALVKEIKLESHVMALDAQSPSSRVLYGVLDNGKIMKFSPNGVSGYTLLPIGDVNAKGYGCSIHPHKSLCLASSLTGIAQLIDLKTNDILNLNGMSRVAFNTTGSLFAVGADFGKKCVIYDTDKRSIIAQFDNVGGVLDISFSPDDRFVCIVSLAGNDENDGRMIVVDLAQKKIVFDTITRKLLLFKSRWYNNKLYVGDDAGKIHIFEIPDTALRKIGRSLDLAQVAVVYWLTGNNKARIKAMSKEYRAVFDTLPDELKELLRRLY